MPLEIERKFLVTGNEWRAESKAETRWRQGYLLASAGRVVRIRASVQRAFITIKGPSKGCARAEYEYEIPVADAEEMLASLCAGYIIEKTRYVIPWEGLHWEVDVFHGANEGLVVAEIELKSADQSFTLPDWIGNEVTGDPRYYNAMLSREPFSQWCAHFNQ
ncbi:MAG: CYTH domain-containing protein [Candidatus Sumerlaeota bacterium]|nr:CYTH domain-containing protein [Candidatus Sumerlaeota bacterium]